jgi:tryptophanyl-tRNA synthetase
MMRTFARRFNRMYKVDFFPIPVPYNFGQNLIKIPGLDGSGKMGKSEGEGNAIFLADDPKVIRKKVMRAVTDSGPEKENQEKPQAIQNLFSLMEVVSQSDTIKFFDDAYNSCNIRYGDLKKQLAEDIIAFTEPLHEKIIQLHSDEAYLKKIVSQGAEKARESASKTLKEVRKIIGFKNF